MKNLFGIWAQRAAWAFSMTLTVWVVNAWAGNGFEFTRETYDLMMRWVNFIILAALIIKYARRPIANFLMEKKDDVAATIDRLETQKQAAQNRLLECQRQLVANQEHLTEIKNKIVAEGEARTMQLIAAAKNDSRIMMETAQLRIDHMIRETHARITSELVDTATEIAMTKIPGMLTAEDHDRLIREWMEAVQS